jgi:hypothetical protein
MLRILGLEDHRLTLVEDADTQVSGSPWSCWGVEVDRAVSAGDEGNPGMSPGDPFHFNS